MTRVKSLLCSVDRWNGILTKRCQMLPADKAGSLLEGETVSLLKLTRCVAWRYNSSWMQRSPARSARKIFVCSSDRSGGP